MRVAVIGGGAAGQIAASFAAQKGHSVTLFERNEKLGKKLYITGKGRCNLTNHCDPDSFFRNVVRNPRFLHSAYSFFDADAIIALIEGAGVQTKTERGQRVFPSSDKSSDVLKALDRIVRNAGVAVRLNTRVSGIAAEQGRIKGVQFENHMEPFDAVILATGGLSYPTTGSTGDGYRFARELGHTVTDLHPSLVPLETTESWCGSLSGLSLKNVVLSAYRDGKLVFSEMGEMLFTHFGVSGPLILSCSSVLAKDPSETLLTIDLKPGLTKEQLDARLIRDITANQRKSVAGAFHGLLPASLLPVVLSISKIDPDFPASRFSKAMRSGLVETLKALPVHVRGARPYSEAVITCGGVSVKEVNPSTMESKIVRNLFFAGEILDVDAFTGGFNLQIAWSTGALAGSSIPDTESVYEAKGAHE